MCKRKCCQNWTKLEICLTIISIMLTIIILSSIFLAPYRDDECTTEACLLAATKIQQFIDPTVDPCENFYNFTCGNFVRNYAEDRAISSSIEQQFNLVNKRLRQIINEPINSNDSNSLFIAKQFYQRCINDSLNDKDFKETILNLLGKLGGWPLIEGSKWREYEFNWVKMMVKSRKLGLKFNVFLDVTIKDGLPKIIYPTDSQEIDDKYVDYYKNLIVATVEYFNVPRVQAELVANEIVKFELKLIQVIESVRKNPTGDYEENLVELQNKITEINWTKWLENITLTQKKITQDIKIYNKIESYYNLLDDLIRQTPKTVQANYFIWKVLEHLSNLFPVTIRQKFDDYQLLKNKKMKDRSATCIDNVRFRMKHVLESVYAQRTATRSLINQITNIIESIQIEIKRRIRENSWMDRQTRESALNKTELTIKIIGGPDFMLNSKMFDQLYGYDNFIFDSDNIILMANQLQNHNYQQRFNKLFDMSMMIGDFDLYETNWATVNGRYHTLMNLMILCTGILEGDLYNSDRPKYLNYGSLGHIIGHEMAHALDPFRPLYHTNNGFQPWILQQSFEKYMEKINCMRDEFNRVLGTTRTHNVAANMMENLADFIGIDLTYRAYQDSIQDKNEMRLLPGLKYNANQLFWIQHSTFYCFKKLKISKLDFEQKDTHSLPIFRVLGPLRSSKYFAKDFNCPVNSFMNPQIKCDLI